MRLLLSFRFDSIRFCWFRVNLCRSLALVSIAAIATLTNLEQSWALQSKAAQESEEIVLPSSRVRDTGTTTVIFGDPNKVNQDVHRLATDLGFGGFSEQMGFIKIEPDSCYSLESGVVCYRAISGSAAVKSFIVQHPDRVLDTLQAKSDLAFDNGEWFPLGQEPYFPVPPYLFGMAGSNQYGMLKDGELLATGRDRRAWVEDVLVDAKLLRPRLDATTLEIIDKSGISILDFNDDDVLKEALTIEDLVGEDLDRLGEDEVEWLTELAETVVQSDFGVVGLKYHDEKVLELRASGLLNEGVNFNKLFDLEATQRDWKPDLGLPRAQLVLAGAIQLDGFHSPAAPRAIPQLLATQFGNTDQKLEFLQGNMLRVLLELGGDSWNELTAARLGLYFNEPGNAKTGGKLALLGVLDSKDPAAVLNELHALSRITSPMVAAERTEQKNEEIRKMIAGLSSSRSAMVSRSETRLRLAGPAAIPLLQEAAKEGDLAVKNRIERLLMILEKEKGKIEDGPAVADPWFWSRLNPGLYLLEAQEEIASFKTHHIEITPDPSKSEEQVQQASATMAAVFGDEWAKVRVVQVNEHFVFMLGSNKELLLKAVQQVSKGESELTTQLAGVGHGPQKGPLQLFLDSWALLDLLQVEYWDFDKQEPDDSVCWLGLNVQRRSASIDVLVPVQQVIPFVGLMFP